MYKVKKEKKKKTKKKESNKKKKPNVKICKKEMFEISFSLPLSPFVPFSFLLFLFSSCSTFMRKKKTEDHFC